MALHSLYCADVPLRNCSLTHLCSGLEKDTSFLHQGAFWPFKVVQGHPRSMILVQIESAYTTSY